MPSRATVLLIDDDPDVRASLRRMIALDHDVQLRIVEAVLQDQNRVLPVSTLIDYPGIGEVCMSLPAVVGRSGVKHRVDVPLDSAERAGLEASARSIREVAERFGAV